MPYIINGSNIYNSFIISPPGYGKTTILKDIIRNLSLGMKELNIKSLDIGVVDERGEISAMFKGKEQNDLGMCVDIIENIPKDIGIRMLVRSMAPNVIVADEVGKKEDIDAINYAFCSGVKGIFTCHGDCYEDFVKNPFFTKIKELNIIDKLIFLSEEKGKVKSIVNLKEEKNVFNKIS